MRKTYAHHAPTPETTAKIQELRRRFSELHDLIESVCPISRERSVAVTSLEDTAMWAIKALVVNDPLSNVTE